MTPLLLCAALAALRDAPLDDLVAAVSAAPAATVAYLFPPRPDVTLADLTRFPSRLVCEDQLAFLDHRRLWLTAQVDLHGADLWWAQQWAPQIDDADQRIACWETLHETHIWADYGQPADDHWAVVWLTRLRERLGADAWRLGAMPGPADLRFLQRVP